MTKKNQLVVPALLSLLLALTVTAAANQDHSSESAAGPNRPATRQAVPDEEANHMAVVADDAALSIPASAFKPRKRNVEWGPDWEGGCINATSGDPRTWWHAPVYLPQGATISTILFFYSDTSTEYNAEANLTAYDMYGSVRHRWDCDVQGDYYGWNVDSFTVDNHLVDNHQNFYVLNWRPRVLGYGSQLCSFRIYYVPPPLPVFLPIVSSGV